MAALALYILYFAFRLPWLLTLPVSEAPDEANHMWVVQFLYEHLRLPTHEEVFAQGTPAIYGSLAQFGYLPHLLIAKFFPLSMLATTARFGSLLIGLGTIWAAIKIGRELFPGRTLYALALPLLLIVHPQLVFVNSYTNPDSTTITLASVIFYLLIISIKRGLTVSRSLLIGLLLGWMAITKQTGLVLIPMTFLAMVAALWIHGTAIATSIYCVAGALAVATLLCAWWFVRNYFEFSGDIFGSHTMYKTWATILPVKNGVIIHPWPPLTSHGWWRYVWFDFWGLFGYMNRYLWKPIYFLYLLITGASIFGWCQKSEAPPLTVTEARAEKTIWLLFAVCILLHIGSMIYVTLTNVSGPHGRYIFPSIIPFFALLLNGLSRLTPRAGKALTCALIAISAISSVGAWLVFYRP